MKKICIFLLMMFCACFFMTGCTTKQKPNMVQSHRRFAKYMPSQNSQQGLNNVIDLSEGPRQSYDADLGPQNLNFEMKIVDPY